MTEAANPGNTVTDAGSGGEPVELTILKTASDPVWIQLTPTLGPDTPTFRQRVRWKVTGSAVLPPDAGDFNGPDPVVGLNSSGAESVFLAEAGIDADGDESLSAPEVMYTVVVKVIHKPTVSIAATVPETQESGGLPAKLTVTRTGDLSLPLTVLYEVSGTATPDEDYTQLSVGVTFAADEDMKEIDVVPIDDNHDEEDETVAVTLIPNPNQNYEVGGASSDGVTILDDPADHAPVVTIAATDPDAFENGPDPGEFTITRSGDLTNSLEVHFIVAGTATEDTDYPALTQPVTIQAEESTVTFQVNPVADGLEEGDEEVEVTLTEPPGCQGGAAYQIGAEKLAVVYIADMDLTVDIDGDVDRNGLLEDADEAGEISGPARTLGELRRLGIQ